MDLPQLPLTQHNRPLQITTPFDDDTLLLQRMSGEETLSQPFNFTLDLLSQDPEIELKQLIGQPLLITLQPERDDEHHDAKPRYFHGVIQDIARINPPHTAARSLTAYRAQLVPWLTFLQHTSDCRIFQDESVPIILQSVLSTYGQLAKYQFNFRGEYPLLNYCVQYNESDFHFISHLCEEAGIYYHFEHSKDGHTLIFSDNSTHCAAIATPQVPYHPHTTGRSSHLITQWHPRRTVAASRISLNTFDFKQPTNLLDVTRPNDTPRGNLPVLKHYRYEGAASYKISEVGTKIAERRAQAAHWPTKLFQGAGPCRSFQAGRYFDLVDHPDHPVSRRDPDEAKFIVITVKHHAQNVFFDEEKKENPQPYSAEITAIRRKIPFQPEQKTHRPKMPGPQTATVVGPSSETIHADKFGRVKVHFHWDQTGPKNGADSCWIRVASPWAGSDMGGVSPPRIGQEVIVDFLDGNPDRPIITGRVYNALQMPPFGNEVSGMRSKTLKGTGFNEVTMHDRPGRELLNMQAERDYTLLVKHDQISMVKNDKTTTVEQNHRLNVKANQSIAVEQNRQTMITGNDTEVVQGNRSEEVSGHHQESIHGTENVVVTLASSESIGLGKALNVGAGYAVNVGGAMNTLAGAASFEEVGLSKKTMVGKTYTIDVGDRVEIKTGYSSLVMESDGTIRLKGVNVEVEGTTGAWVRGETVGLEGPGDVEPSRLPPMGMFNEYFHIQDQAAGIELEKIPFRIKGEAGEIEGRTATGLTHHYSTGDTEKQIDLEYTGLEHESHGW